MSLIRRAIPVISGNKPRLNYVLLGKVYEMKGMNREAADAYLTAFNLRPGQTPFTGLKMKGLDLPCCTYLDKFQVSE